MKTCKKANKTNVKTENHDCSTIFIFVRFKYVLSFTKVNISLEALYVRSITNLLKMSSVFCTLKGLSKKKSLCCHTIATYHCVDDFSECGTLWSLAALV